MKYQLSFIAFIAFASAQGIQDDDRVENEYSKTDWYSVPAPSGVYAEPSSAIVDPSAQPSEVTFDDSCSTALTTTTTTRTVSVVTQISSSLLSVSGSIDLSSFISLQPEPMTSVTGVIELSTWIAPQPPSDALTVIVPESSATDIEENSVAPPQVPYPTASDKPSGTTIVGTTSPMSTVPGLPVFTAAADAVGVPVVVACVLGWVALVLLE